MRSELGVPSLWTRWIPLYFWAMARKLDNTPLFGNMRAFWAFLDGYASSMDLDPTCGRPLLHQSPEALWDDFVRVASDASYAFHSNVKQSK